jgi:hypothetical protein
MNDILKILGASVFSPRFYSDVSNRPFKPAAFFLATLGMIGIGIWAMMFFPSAIPVAYSDMPDAVVSAYPEDLVITLADGQLSINKPVPYYVPNTLFPNTASDKPMTNLVVFDTDDVLPSSLEENSTALLVKKTYMISGGNQQRFMSFSKFTATTTIARSDVAAFVGSVAPYIPLGIIGGGAAMVVVFTLLGGILWAVTHIVYLLVPSTIVYLLSRFSAVRPRYAQAYMTALYASVPVSVVAYVFGHLHVNPPWFIVTATIVGIALVNIFRSAPEETIVDGDLPHPISELKSMLSVPAIAIGASVDVIGSAICAAFMLNMIPSGHSATSVFDLSQLMYHDPLQIALNVLIGGAFTVLAGFLAARIARKYIWLNSILASTLCVFLTVFALFSPDIREGVGVPGLLIALVANPLLALGGGYLYSRFEHRS